MFRFLFIAALAALGRASDVLSKEPTDEGIVGGAGTTIEQHPYQLSLEIYNQHFCGASLIRGNVALTAAHCTQEYAATLMKVRAGSTYKQQGGSVANVVAKCEHPKYIGVSARNLDYDVSVLQLDRSFTLSGSIQTIQLQPVGAAVPEGTIATATGWGSISPGQPPNMPNQLQQINIPKISFQRCKSVWQSYLTDRMTCYGSSGKGVCGGDSGGPVVVNGRQTGISSFVGSTCGDANTASVFAKISHGEIANHIQQCMARF